jgi:putative ABC transport system permease protein
MFKNYMVVAFRNLLKNKYFTIINIIGLGIALSVCIVAFFNHMFQYEFDRTHKNFNQIYRVTCFRDMQGREQEYGIVPATLGLEIKKDIPGIEKAARLIRTGTPVKMGDDLFPSQIAYADPEFLDIFTFPAISGDTRSISSQANVLVSQKMANKLFGNENPLGKTISILNDNGKEFTYTVSAVFADLPDNSSFRIDVLSHFDNFLLMWGVKDADWKLWTNVLFIQVPDKALIPSIIQSLKSYLPVQNKARQDFIINRFNLIPLKDVGKSTRTIWSSGLFPSLHPAAMLAPPVMALFILLIACFNFANTSRAIFSKRLKEIGLRKTFGGQRKQLVTQFMFETFIVCFLALFAGIALAEFLVPAYSNLWAYMSIQLTLTRYAFFWIFVILLVLVTGFLAGVYPALYVSSFSPVSVIKGESEVKGSGKLSMILLTLQFSISVMALVMGIVFSRNASYQKTLDLGYDRDKLIVVPVSQSIFTSLRDEVLANPKVILAEGTQNHIGWGSYRRPVKDQDKRYEVDVLDIGPGYAQTMGLRLLGGRLFDETRKGADRTDNAIVVNRKFVDALGWKEAVGKYVTLYDTTRLNIIGVVEDFYTNGLWQKIEPTMLRLSQSDRYGILAIRANPGDLAGILEYTSQKWKNLAPNSVFSGRLQEDNLQEEKDINGSILKVNIFLAIIATLLSLIGMYNMVSLDIIKRTKEIGIRKIQGAPVHILMFLISKKFILVLVISSILGCVGGYYMSSMLLDSIWDYFVRIGPGILVLSVLIMVLATLITIIYKILKAALRNPVESLRYE